MASTIHTVMILVITTRVFGHDEGDVAVHPVRSKREVLIFPGSSVLQLTFGVSLALDIGTPSGQLSFGLQQNINLPTNYTELLLPPTVKVKRSLNAKDSLQEFFGRFATNGTECLKKVICQVSETPLEGGLLEEILNFAFTPSNHEDLFGGEGESHPFLVSESIGRVFGDCHSAFPDCERSPLDLISSISSGFI